jgi:hypothetical protein
MGSQFTYPDCISSPGFESISEDRADFQFIVNRLGPVPGGTLCPIHAANSGADQIMYKIEQYCDRGMKIIGGRRRDNRRSSKVEPGLIFAQIASGASAGIRCFNLCQVQLVIELRYFGPPLTVFVQPWGTSFSVMVRDEAQPERPTDAA